MMAGFAFGSGPAFNGPSFGNALTSPEPDPLADVEYTGDLAEDSVAELSAMEDAYRARREGEDKRFRNATDSEYWFAVCFTSREQKEAFLAEFGLAEIGDKYLDGNRAAEVLRLR